MGSGLQNTEKMLLSLDVWITDEDQLTLSSFTGCESVWCTYFNNEWKKKKGVFFPTNFIIQILCQSLSYPRGSMYWTNID